ncbi:MULTISPECIES: hypothetical protein [Pseudonocardia]|uniref:Shikimate 5-dehydrogenase n=2 Tax=Pseudonocardia TaxID=1847 RepID=A0A1Y2MTG8_PSEAH|nr:MULTISPECIES: hypothetical protein [Pseudonocardia]OSY38505.1 shikimate 5-dehydrogenase [Pseudonocardia autotrophica]TDN77052.1 shikimate dehydrogenase [Pseudonocardia autotrophica]BBG01058.1 hypothetical protein Pdca_22670 [Pseudonocardia autotrophica]GEC26686.1 hypothetical protein PSA01_37150 [Pseudonocardia saturnea]
MQSAPAVLDVVESMLHEVTLTPPDRAPAPPVVAGIGTTASRALAGSLLADAFAAEGITPGGSVPFDDPDALLADRSWSLALVLSPWKIELASRLPAMTASATRIVAADTLVRTAQGVLGVNTNTWAAQAAMQALLPGDAPPQVLVLGSGGSARSVAAAVRRAWPRAELFGSARNAAALTGWATAFDATAVSPADAADLSPTLVVNTTTWGETPESEQRPFAFDTARILAPGRYLFDLNNRTSTLQTAALTAGMSVMSGTLMQRVTNACRARLLRELSR